MQETQNSGLWKKSYHEDIDIYINYDAPGDDRANLNGEYVLLTNKSGR
jgi:hypothetical protein